MAKPNRAFLYLVLFFTIINAGIFIIAQIIIDILNLSLIISGFFIFGLSLFSGVVISLIISTAAPIFKEYMATYRQLSRLDNLSHPLLVRLADEATGTYFHSLSVANLAYRVAKELDLNTLMVRVGAYFHDIGKLEKPQYFIENQQKQNPHDELDLDKSIEIIRNHIEKGIVLAREAGLPPEIINFIPEHAGTTVIGYFYDLAKEKNKKIKKENFQYCGPKPKSLETAIVMIADSLEAKLRLLTDYSRQNIKTVVDDVIEDKIKQNQFSNFDFDDKDIQELKTAFKKATQAQYHNRILYPKDKKRNHFLKKIIPKK